MVALCTLKANDEAGWKYLELRTKSAAVRRKTDPKAARNRMLSFAARKVLTDGAQSALSGVAIPMASTRNGGAAAGDHCKTEYKGGAREPEGCKSFAELLESLKDRVASKGG